MAFIDLSACRPLRAAAKYPTGVDGLPSGGKTFDCSTGKMVILGNNQNI